jgi:hypothetical protein
VGEEVSCLIVVTPAPSPIKHRQPNRRLIGRCPCHSVLLVGRDIHEVPGPHFQHPVLELKSCCPLEHQHPLGLILVVPEAIRGSVPRTDDPLDPDAGALLENGGEFFGEVNG